MEIDLKGWLGIAAFFISVVNLIRSVQEKKVSIDASIEIGNDEAEVIIYNNSTRKITVSYFEIYNSRCKWLAKRDYFHTWYSDGDSPKYLIAPHEYINIKFDNEYSISGKLIFRNGINTYLRVVIAGKTSRTIKLR